MKAALLAIVLMACQHDPPAFSIVRDECARRAAVHAASGLDAAAIGMHAGFPSQSVNGTIERSGRFRGNVSAMPNGPGPSMSLDLELCVSTAQTDAFFAALEQGEAPDTDFSIHVVNSDPIHCVDALVRSGARTPFGAHECHFRAAAASMASAIFGLAQARDAPPSCPSTTDWCAVMLGAGTIPHVHDTYPSMTYQFELARAGGLHCAQGSQDVHVELSNAGALLDWLLGDASVPSTTGPSGDSYEAFAGVRVRRAGSEGYFDAATPEGTGILERYRRIQAQLPSACRLPP